MNKCLSCESSIIRLVGKIPPIDNFAGKILAKPLEGGNLYECKDCYLLFRYPRLTKEEMESIYAQASEDNWSLDNEGRKDWLIALDWIHNLPSASTVLDVGCFDGQFLDYLGPGYIRFGVEINNKASKLAEEKGVNIVGDSFSDLKSLSDKFDVVIAMDVIEHVEDPLKFLPDLAINVRSGGKIIISSGNTEAWSWKLMGSSYYYCNIGEHISFVNPHWFEKAANYLGLRVNHTVTFSHNNYNVMRRFNDLCKNLLYKVSPCTSAWLREKGFGGTDPTIHEELAYIPPKWWSAKDHFICLLEKE